MFIGWSLEGLGNERARGARARALRGHEGSRAARRRNMTKSFGSLVFTPVVKALQERYGSRRQYARMEQLGYAPQGLGPDEKEYLSETDTFYMASLGQTGWPYVQHRGGPKGFLKVIDNKTLAFADFRGNKQYIST